MRKNQEWRERDLARKVAFRAAKAAKEGRQFKRQGPDATAARIAAKELARVEKALCRAAWRHDQHVKTYRQERYKAANTKRYRAKYAGSVEFMLRERIRRQLVKKSCLIPGVAEMIRSALKRSGNSPRVERLLGYSMRELRTHLERQFSEGMDWSLWTKNGIHIDHIEPRRCFDLSTADGVRSYWALDNLQPLWAEDNLRKSDRVDGEWQRRERILPPPDIDEDTVDPLSRRAQRIAWHIHRSAAGRAVVR